MRKLWRRIRDSWRLQGEELEANAIENAQVAHEAAERDKRHEQELPADHGAGTWLGPQ